MKGSGWLEFSGSLLFELPAPIQLGNELGRFKKGQKMTVLFMIGTWVVGSMLSAVVVRVFR
jgi:hypothetical protein